jgi:hypothetical protein
MGFMSFGGPQEAVKYELPELEVGAITERLDAIKTSLDNIQVIFEPRIEVPPAQIAVEVDLSSIDTALQEIASKEFRPINEIVIPAPQITNNVHIKIAQELLWPLYSISGVGMLLVLIEIVRLFR